MIRRHWYALTGSVLSLSVPLGLFGVRRVYRRPHRSPQTLIGEISSDPVSYSYVGLSSAVVFTGFGYVLGRSADRLEQLSETDALTGLGNTRALKRWLEAELARTRRYHQPLSLVLLDLDGLKRINDGRGHRAGDQALKKLAAAIRTELRDTDNAARWGGDEFAIVAPNTNGSAAQALAERIGARVARRDTPPTITCSAGVATVDGQERDRPIKPSGLMRSADLALYDSKRRGRNAVSLAANVDVA